MTLGVGAQLHLHVEGVPLGGHLHGLYQAGYVAHRPAEVQRRHGRDALGGDVQLDAELAAGEGLLVAHVLPAGTLLQHLQMLVDVDAAPDDHQLSVVALAFQVRDGRFRLQRGLVVGLRDEPGLDHRGRLGKGPVGVALEYGLLEADVGPVRVHLHGVRGQRLLEGVDDRQEFVLHLDGRGGRHCLVPGEGGDGGHRVADVAHLVLTQYRAVAGDVLEPVGALDVLGREHAHHARHLLGGRGVYALDERVRVRTADAHQLQRSRDHYVGGELRHPAGLDQRRRPRMRDSDLGPVRVRPHLRLAWSRRGGSCPASRTASMIFT